MRKQSFRQFVSLLLISCLFTGCASNPTLSYLGNAQLTDYRADAERIAYPDSCEVPPESATFANPPRNVRDRNHDEAWDMPLAEAIHLALLNNKIVRTSSRTATGAIAAGSAGGTSTSTIVSSPQAVASVYDPAIQETGVLFGSRGVESALSEFDTQFTTSMVWGRDEQIQNNLFLAGGIPDGATLQSDTAQMQAELSKVQANGGQLSLSHLVNYNYNNSPGNLFPSVYTGNVQLGYRLPMWAGSGTEFTRIAGPVSENITGIGGVSQGVVIARINNDITIADFEIQVRNMIKDVEDIYWNLYLAYRRYDAEVVARNSALRTWREVKSKFEVGARGGSAADEAQAREQYFDAKARAEVELNNIYSMELELRRMLGLPVNDGRIIRPSDVPITAEFIPDWYVALAEALTRRTELRRQKWNIKSLDLQLIAAENLANPRLDFVSAYQVNMFGDNLFGNNDNDSVGTAQGLNSAYERLTQGSQTGWQLGFQFSMPLGLRRTLAQVRNIELRLAQARELLATQEVDISHELANGFQALNLNYQTAQTRFNQGRAAHLQLQAFEAEYKVGTKTLDLLLQAQTRLARAQIEYYSAIIEYTKSITNIQFRKGTLLEYNNIHLAEGAWSPEAYEEALRRAWARSYAFESDLMHTEPAPFVNDGRVMGPVEFTSEAVNMPGPANGSESMEIPLTDPNGIVPPPPAPPLDGELEGAGSSDFREPVPALPPAEGSYDGDVSIDWNADFDEEQAKALFETESDQETAGYEKVNFSDAPVIDNGY
ncbi:outer membrane channel protein [Symmachiella dynata]|uniref:Outer membrane channel protein n=1 Tax=Symmachiella dynata TaxID=2527995 RepID=A0A517ZMW5_9PLAN|nr:TolC family protein [Symmachiella dynata]QDU43823.1 outer membrane channel protein [Symmachiella dynata]